MEDVLTAVLIASLIISYLGIGLSTWRRAAWRDYENIINNTDYFDYSESGKRKIKERCFRSTNYLLLGWPMPIFESIADSMSQSVNNLVMRPPREAKQRIELERQKRKSIELARNIDMLERSMKVGNYGKKESDNG